MNLGHQKKKRQQMESLILFFSKTLSESFLDIPRESCPGIPTTILYKQVGPLFIVIYQTYFSAGLKPALNI